VHIGVLALQGAYARHAQVLRELGHAVALVRTPRELDSLEGLVLPGGESSVQLELIARAELEAPLRALIASGIPVLATCAGLILLARHVQSPQQHSLGMLDITVTRNAWGRQIRSFEAQADGLDLPLVFIRAPRITEHGPCVEVLLRYREEPVLVRQRNVTAATFHPELTADSRVHEQVFGGHSARLQGPWTVPAATS
jgi:pyridoxal 5'-phosphate synthase pdxT subunit